MLKINEGKMDRTIRIIVGIVVLAIGLILFTGIAKTIAIVLGFAGIITGVTGFCGLYTILGINTCSIKK